jgi:hypothetical protein
MSGTRGRPIYLGKCTTIFRIPFPDRWWLVIGFITHSFIPLFQQIPKHRQLYQSMLTTSKQVFLIIKLVV